MEKYIIGINWEGPLNIGEVIRGKNNDVSDYGVYQIYGHHILYKDNALLYIGIAAKETFSYRFREHKINLLKDDDQGKIKIYLGMLRDSSEYVSKDDWEVYYRDAHFVEDILIYKYLPSYNGCGQGDYPKLDPYKEIKLVHKGDRGRLEPEDIAPSDYLKGE